MIEKFIINYIEKIKKEDIIDFGLKYNINLNNTETDFIYENIKKNWRELIYGNPTPIFNELKKISPSNYQKIEELYIEFKNKYKSYL